MIMQAYFNKQLNHNKKINRSIGCVKNILLHRTALK